MISGPLVDGSRGWHPGPCDRASAANRGCGPMAMLLTPFRCGAGDPGLGYLPGAPRAPWPCIAHMFMAVPRGKPSGGEAGPAGAAGPGRGQSPLEVPRPWPMGPRDRAAALRRLPGWTGGIRRMTPAAPEWASGRRRSPGDWEARRGEERRSLGRERRPIPLSLSLARSPGGESCGGSCEGELWGSARGRGLGCGVPVRRRGLPSRSGGEPSSLAGSPGCRSALGWLGAGSGTFRGAAHGAFCAGAAGKVPTRRNSSPLFSRSS